VNRGRSPGANYTLLTATPTFNSPGVWAETGTCHPILVTFG
jgi:hypothetical protein